MIYKAQHSKLRIQQRQPHNNGGELKFSRRTINSCSTIDTRSVSVKGHAHYKIWRSFWTPVYVNNTNYVTFTNIQTIKRGPGSSVS